MQTHALFFEINYDIKRRFNGNHPHSKLVLFIKGLKEYVGHMTSNDSFICEAQRLMQLGDQH